MNDNDYIYQAMFMLDNGEVRDQGFNAVRDWVKATLEKHGAEVKVLRHWRESQLAYPIQGNTRSTYLLGYLQAGQQTVSKAKAEMYLLGPVIRMLVLKEEEIPAAELALGIADVADTDVAVPDDEPEFDPFADEPEAEESDGGAAPEAKPEVKAEAKTAAKAEGEGGKAAEKPAAAATESTKSDS
ncbi:MAG: 30S ribosomal protein S6 [Planctomycetes bacterium]|nr:30S ribosomal protein S6 [Planctomycetota bacterium]